MITIKRSIRRLWAHDAEDTRSFGCERAAEAKDASAKTLEEVILRDKAIKTLSGLLLSHAHHQEPVR